jgi:transposase
MGASARRVRAKPAAARVPSPSSLAHVEDFQHQVVATWRAAGRNVPETARELGVSSWTVRYHLRRAWTLRSAIPTGTAMGHRCHKRSRELEEELAAILRDPVATAKRIAALSEHTGR